jgi:hypothetical protein
VLAGAVLFAAGMLDITSFLSAAPLPDQRLRKRAQLMVQSLVRGHSATSLGLLAPADRTPESFTRGAYRFFDHDAVTLPALHAPIEQALTVLVPQGHQAFVAHDVSVLNFSGHQRKEDLIPVGNDHTWGYELYQALVISSDGRPLGAAVTELRNSAGLLSSSSDTVLPFSDHLEQTERAVDTVEKLLPKRSLVHLCDREFDDLALLRHMQGKKYVIRCQHLTRTVSVHGEQRPLSHYLKHVSLSEVGEVVRRSEQPGESKKESYRLFVGQTQVTLCGRSLRGVAKRKRKPEKGAPLHVRVVVSELRRCGHKPLRWVLLTNLEDSAEDVVSYYLLRWKVERIFWLAKLGFRLETWHQESAERVGRRLLLVQLAAMAVYQLSQQTEPEALATIHRLALLGGWPGRKTTPIGPTVLMRGVMIFIAAVQLCQQLGQRELFSMAKSLEPLLGPILRRGEKM